MKREYYHWFSKALSREMELLVFGHGGARVIVFPTRAGRFFDYENFGLLDPLKPSIEEGKLQVFCVDSVDAESFYCSWCRAEDRIKRHQSFEDYIVYEVIPFTSKMNSNSSLIFHGCSMGAYHSVNLAFRFPHLATKVVAISGRYDLTVAVAEFRGLFDGHYDESIYYHMPLHYLPNLKDEILLQSLRRLQIILVAGKEDPFLASTHALSSILLEKEIEHEFHVWDGYIHKPSDWKDMIPYYL